MSRVIHFEIHATDPAKLLPFYTQRLGWQASQWGDMPYWLLNTGDDSQPGIHGALLQRHGSAPPVGQQVNAFVCTVQVADVDATFAQALRLGAQEALPIQHYPGVGRVGYVLDPDGNVLGLMQPEAPVG